jgi:hypothetical protein
MESIGAEAFAFWLPAQRGAIGATATTLERFQNFGLIRSYEGGSVRAIGR